MSKSRRIAIAGASALIALSSISGAVMGSSHREAPLIAGDPEADITDLYAFVSPDRPNTVTIIANYSPFQWPAGGPNFYSFDPDVLYWMKIDNDGDGLEDVTFEYRFDTDVANPDSFLYSGYGPIPAVASNVTQTFSVWRNGVEIASDLDVPAPNIGPRTTPMYKDIAADGVHLLASNRRVFAGQRDDPFFVDLGSIFDLGGLRRFNEAHLIPLDNEIGRDDVAGFNVNSIALQVPRADLGDGGDANDTVGIWAGASRPSMDASASGMTPSGVDWVQVSRLGNPLINEVIIPLGEKDEWNASDPVNDSNYLGRYTDPELAAIINTVYPSLPDTRTTGRSDLVLILGQGVPGLNDTNTGDTLYDMLRLNMGIAPSDDPDRLGVIFGDVAGFPNGRRLLDDIVDIEIRAVADGYGSFLATNFGLPNLSPNNMLNDGCRFNDKAFRQHFPYVANPRSGYRNGETSLSPCVRHGAGPINDTPGLTGAGVPSTRAVANARGLFAA